MSHNIIAPTSAFFLSHKLAVVNLFQQTRMVGIRHSVATATAFLKTTLPVKEGRFRFISHKFTASNLRYQARRMNNRSYVTEQTTALHLIYQKFNYLWRKLKSLNRAICCKHRRLKSNKCSVSTLVRVQQTQHMNNCSYVIARPLPFP